MEMSDRVSLGCVIRCHIIKYVSVCLCEMEVGIQWVGLKTGGT